MIDIIRNFIASDNTVLIGGIVLIVLGLIIKGDGIWLELIFKAIPLLTGLMLVLHVFL